MQYFFPPYSNYLGDEEPNVDDLIYTNGRVGLPPLPLRGETTTLALLELQRKNVALEEMIKDKLMEDWTQDIADR